jgi:hypothetical protein
MVLHDELLKALAPRGSFHLRRVQAPVERKAGEDLARSMHVGRIDPGEVDANQRMK